MEIANSLHCTPVKGKPLSPFISKLKLLLSDEKYRNAIRWSESGGAILITDGEAFKRQVLDESAEMFKTRNFTSFVRQLNLYGFRKVPVNGKGDPSKNMEFEHVHFKRDKPELMHLVHRTCSSRKKKRVAQGTLTSFKRESPSQLGALQYGKFKMAEVGKGAVSKTRRGNNAFYCKSPNSSPPKSGADNEDVPNYEFNHSRYNSFEVTSATGGNSLIDYYYQKHQEEQIAVQLLLNLRYSLSSPPSYENCQPSQAACDTSCTAYPMYMYPSVPFYGQYRDALY
ncbi:uncharacterized protein [Montipora capricornis]|uniref:uncharacterized protein n=1 Tax=Montipora foliosa TaxID=591990 RepID=UPI0035F12339